MPHQHQDRMPYEELANRAATSGGGIQAAAFAVGLEEHRRTLFHHARRLREGHVAMAKAAGFDLGQEPFTAEGEADAMGDIIVTGDICFGDEAVRSGSKLPWERGDQGKSGEKPDSGAPVPPAESTTQAPAPDPTRPPAAVLSPLARLAIGAALAATGLNTGLQVASFLMPRSSTTNISEDLTGIRTVEPGPPAGKSAGKQAESIPGEKP